MAGQAITYDNSGGAGLYGAFASGTLTADDTTPVAVNILCGFQPSRIYLFNTDTLQESEWIKGMPAGYYRKVLSDVTSYPTSGGPVVYAGASATGSTDTPPSGGYSEGFTIPAALQAASDVIVWVAYR